MAFSRSWYASTLALSASNISCCATCASPAAFACKAVTSACKVVTSACKVVTFARAVVTSASAFSCSRRATSRSCVAFFCSSCISINLSSTCWPPYSICRARSSNCFNTALMLSCKASGNTGKLSASSRDCSAANCPCSCAEYWSRISWSLSWNPSGRAVAGWLALTTGCCGIADAVAGWLALTTGCCGIADAVAWRCSKYRSPASVCACRSAAACVCRSAAASRAACASRAAAVCLSADSRAAAVCLSADSRAAAACTSAAVSALGCCGP